MKTKFILKISIFSNSENDRNYSINKFPLFSSENKNTFNFYFKI
jgi:hypothetical protein